MTKVSRLAAAFAKRRAAVLSAGVGLFHLAANLVWLARDTLPPAWDQAAHAGHCLSYLGLLGHPSALSLTKLLTVSSYYPPFFYIATVPVTALFGFSCDVLALAQAAFLVLLAYSVFRLGERLFGPAAAAGAVLLIALTPAIYGLSREVLLDLPVTAMVALALTVVLAGRRTAHPASGALLGLVLGLAVMTKWTAAVFVLGPLLLVLGREAAGADKAARKTLAVSIGLALLVFLAVILPWFFANLSGFERTASVALGEDAVAQGDPSGLAASVAWYGKATRRALLLPALGIITLAGLVAFAFRRGAGKAAAFLGAWALPAFFVFVLVPNKDGRNIVPLLPALALAAAAGFDALRPKAAKRAVWTAVLLVGLAQFAVLSFGRPPGPAGSLAKPPRGEDWRIGEILESASIRRRGPVLRVAVLPDLPYFNFSTFRFTAALEALPFVIDPAGTGPPTLGAFDGYDVVISKSGALATRPTAAERAAFRRLFESSARGRGRARSSFRPWKAFSLPDGSKARLYVRVDPE